MGIKMRLTSRPVIVGAGIVMLSIAVGPVVLPRILSLHATPTRTCTLSEESKLSESDFVGFEQFVDEKWQQPPVKDVEGSGSELDYVKDFTGGWIRGFVTEAAVTGSYREDLDQRARAIGYTVGKWPYVPLVGDIVAQLGRPLEVYESLTEYTSVGAAQSWASALRADRINDGGDVLTLPDMPQGSITTASVLGPNDGEHERDVEVVVPLRSGVLRLDIQGSPTREWDPEVSAITAKSLSRIQAACASGA